MRWNPLRIDSLSERELRKRIRFPPTHGISFYVICNDILKFGLERSYRVPHLTLYPNAYKIDTNYLDPQSVLFADVIDYFKDYYPSIYDWDVRIYFSAGHQTTSRHGMWYRTVGYWMQQPRGDMEELPIYFYHGTCSELWYEGIAAEGLKPRILGHGGSFGSFGAGGALSKEDRIYISVHPDNAAREASFQAAQKHGGFPTILKIRSSWLEPELLVPDEDAHVEKVMDAAYRMFECEPPAPLFISLREMGTCAYMESIPIDAIEPFIRCTSKHQSDKDYRWIRWDDPPRRPHPVTEQLWESIERRKEIEFPYISLGWPVFYALYEAGIVDMYQPPGLPSGHRVAERQVVIVDEINDRSIKDILKSAVWASDAAALARENWNEGVNSLKRLIAEVDETELQLLIELLVRNGFFTIRTAVVQKYGPEPDYEPYKVEVRYLEETSRWGNRMDNFVGLAKDLHRNKLTYSRILELIKYYQKTYSIY